MKGLEISTVNLVQALASAETQRLDPEYFQKAHLVDEIRVASAPHQFRSFVDAGLRVDASAFYPSIEDYYVLQPQSVPAEVLLTFLRLPVCELMDLHTSASLYPAISERDLLNLPFPKLPAKTCDAIVQAVRSAHAARREAQSLLARAQHAVEIAIEQNERVALDSLKN